MLAKQTISATSAEYDCRRRLIEAASAEFLKDGFRGASVDRIAAAANVAKQTLYNHFPSKEALFGETIRIGVRDVVVELEDTPGSLEDRLINYGHALRNKLVCAEGLAWYRTVIADLSRLPKLAPIVWREGPMETQRRLAEFLSAAMDRGEMRRDDPVFAAEMFDGMLIHWDQTRALLSGDTELNHQPTRVRQIVACFLRAYQP